MYIADITKMSMLQRGERDTRDLNIKYITHVNVRECTRVRANVATECLFLMLFSLVRSFHFQATKSAIFVIRSFISSRLRGKSKKSGVSYFFLRNNVSRD